MITKNSEIIAENIVYESNFQLLNMVIKNKNRQFFKIDCPINFSQEKFFLIFLHGLEKNISFKDKFFLDLKKCSETMGINLIIPIGLKGSFPDKKDYFSWCPKNFDENMDFIEKIILFLSLKNPNSKMIISGFSNGSYFISEFLQKREINCNGFWIQCGGCRKNSRFLKNKDKKIILEVGKKDGLHLEHVRKFRDILVSSGWKIELDFFYYEFQGEHQFSLENFNKRIKTFMY